MKASLLCYLRGSIGQSRFICHVVYSGMQGISALVLGGTLAKVGSSAKFCVLVFKAFVLWYWGVHQPKKVHLPNLNSRMFRWPSKRSFRFA